MAVRSGFSVGWPGRVETKSVPPFVASPKRVANEFKPFGAVAVPATSVSGRSVSCLACRRAAGSAQERTAPAIPSRPSPASHLKFRAPRDMWKTPGRHDFNTAADKARAASRKQKRQNHDRTESWVTRSWDGKVTERRMRDGEHSFSWMILSCHDSVRLPAKKAGVIPLPSVIRKCAEPALLAKLPG
jgi:hypothetical protein